MGPWAYRVRVSLPELLLVNQSAGSDGALARNLTSYYSRAVVAVAKMEWERRSELQGYRLCIWIAGQAHRVGHQRGPLMGSALISSHIEMLLEFDHSNQHAVKAA